MTGRSPGRDAGGRPIPAPVVTLAVSTTVPDPPLSLGKAGRAVWRRLWSAGRVWLSVDTDWDIMVRLCRGHDHAEAMCARIKRDGLVVAGSVGQPAPHLLLA